MGDLAGHRFERGVGILRGKPNTGAKSKPIVVDRIGPGCGCIRPAPRASRWEAWLLWELQGMPITREEEVALLDPASYHRNGYPWETWAALRRDDPVHFVKDGFGGDSWAVTRYADIIEIERNTEVFKNAPKSIMGSPTDGGLRMIVNMDPPDHPAHRAIANPFFMPRSIEWVKGYAEELINQALDAAMERNGEVIDLQEDVANLVPTAVVSAYLGAPRELCPKIVEWTNQIINASDPAVSKDQGALAMIGQATQQIIEVHARTFAERRAKPQDDLMTALVQARIDGKPLSEIDLASWGMILTTAGHETTQSTFGMAIHALLRFPDQLAMLQNDLSLLPRAIDELLRYISPAIHFVRTPSRDVEIGGKSIRAGEHMVMFYPSANQDEAIFAEPRRLDILRHPNRHLAFGTGPHLCLGQHLTRLELRIMLESFLTRVDMRSIELDAEPERVFTNAVGGYKHLYARMRVLPRR
jgi:cytochrome P450